MENQTQDQVGASLAETKEQVLAVANYRTSSSRWAGGKHTDTVTFGAPTCSGGSHRAWSKNGKWSGSDSYATFTVPENWLEAVYGRGLASVDGMVTLAAEPVQGAGPELFRATWAEQGRGFAISPVSGYIARLTVRVGANPDHHHEDGGTNTYTYHAETARAALDGVARKARLKPARRKGVVDLNRLVRRYGALPVTFADAIACGLCKTGIRSWANAVGCATDGATVAEVVAGYRLRPLAEVMAVVRRVIRDRANRIPVSRTEEEALAQTDPVAVGALADYREERGLPN